MEHTFWHKQSKAEPLFPDMLWDKPENALHAGKLLIIGGNAHSFVAPASAYNASLASGIAAVKVLLPDALKKPVGFLLDGAFAPSNKAGSFSKQALTEWLSHSQWANGVLLAGDFGHNSETIILLEKFATAYSGQLTIAHDALDFIINNPEHTLRRTSTVIVVSFAQLQKLATYARSTQAFTYDMPVARIAEGLHVFTSTHNSALVTLHNGVYYIAQAGNVCTTTQTNNLDNWQIATAACVSVWTLQNPQKQFAALCTAIYEITQH